MYFMQECCAIFVLIVIVTTQTQGSAALNPSVEIAYQQLVVFIPQRPVSLKTKTAGKKGERRTFPNKCFVNNQSSPSYFLIFVYSKYKLL
jgi:hypothetical protein